MAQAIIDFSWEAEEKHGTLVVSARGELDVYWSPRFRDALLGLIEGRDGLRVEIELSGLTFVDSSGLGVLVGAQRRLHERGGELALVNVPGPTYKALEASGLVTHLNVSPREIDLTQP
ncbi:MAG: STAS domain-containing protein [Actinobacteria bacterium]|nr:STAS domain-containing protein [Actinomycetota bacterium]